LEKSFKN